MSLEWTIKLATGFSDIDEQHKELFKKVNDLLNAMKQGKGKDEAMKTVHFLEEYTVHHFGTEENYMKKFSYPDYKDHKAQHDGLIVDLKKVKQQIEKEGPSSFLAIELQKNLGDWLTIHIGNVDKLLGAFLQSKTK